MKKKYTPAELEIIMASVCDVITTSVTEAPDEGGNGGTGEGGGWNEEGWM